jgi:hypothetical protein
MFKFNKSFTAVALAVMAVAASAEDPDKADISGQDKPVASDGVTSPMPDAHRLVILSSPFSLAAAHTADEDRNGGSAEAAATSTQFEAERRTAEEHMHASAAADQKVYVQTKFLDVMATRAEQYTSR